MNFTFKDSFFGLVKLLQQKKNPITWHENKKKTLKDVDLLVCFLKVKWSLLFLATAQLTFSPNALGHCALLSPLDDGWVHGSLFYDVPVLGFPSRTLEIQPRAHVTWALSWTLAFGFFEAGPPHVALLALKPRPSCLSSPSVVPGLQASHYAHLQPDI